MTAVAELMTEAVHTVAPGTTVDAARLLAQDIGVHAFPVLDASGALTGIVSTLDLADDVDGTELAANVMSEAVHTVRPETDVTVAASMLRGLQINHLIVTSDETVVGIISSWDLLESLVAAVRAHTLDAQETPPVAAGDELVIHRPGQPGPLRCRINDVRGPSGLPPYLVIWEDDPSESLLEISIVRHTEIALDGCER